MAWNQKQHLECDSDGDSESESVQAILGADGDFDVSDLELDSDCCSFRNIPIPKCLRIPGETCIAEKEYDDYNPRSMLPQIHKLSCLHK